MQSGISLVMIVKNEEAVLGRCLESVKDYVDEMIVIDTGSEDKTVEIAESFGAKVDFFEWCNDFSAARNFALSKAHYTYRLIMDADEYVLEWDRAQIKEQLQSKQVGVITLVDVFEKEGELKQSKSYLSRMIPDESYYTGAIHEQVVTKHKRVRMPIIIGHDGYLHTDKSERNLEILYQLVKEQPKDNYMLYQLAHTLFVANKNEEAYTYYHKYYKVSHINEGYRCDAIVDYLYNLMAVARFEEGLSIIKKEEQRYSDSPDFHFVCGHFYRELVLFDINKYINYLPYIEKSFLKCLEIGETNKYNSVVGTGSYEAAYNLAAWYEVAGQMEQAKYYYKQAADCGYERAIDRLSQI